MIRFGTLRAGTLTLVLLALTVGNRPSEAQSLPAAAAPTREEILRDREDRSARAPARLVVEDEIERAPCPLADPQYTDVSFVLGRVEFGGPAALTAKDMGPSWEELTGQTVSLATVCDIRDRAAALLRQRGYLATVLVPPQEIADGVVRLQILAAKIVAVRVRGNAARSEAAIGGFLRMLEEMPVFNEREAERYLLLARDLPGYDIRLVLSPAGTVPGEVIGYVNVAYTPIEIDASGQNLGSRDVGRWGGSIRVQLNGLTGFGDQTVVNLFSTSDFREQQVYQIAHKFGLGHDGLRLGGRFIYSVTRPDSAPAFDIRSDATIGTIEAVYPFVRSQARNFQGSIGFDLVDQNVDILSVRTNEDRLRIAYARLDFDGFDEASLNGRNGYSALAPRWRVNAGFEFRQGLAILGATGFCAGCTVQPIRFPGKAMGTVFRANVATEFRPTSNLSLVVAPRAQYSPDALFAYEEFSGGNYTVGRGYDPGTISGDSGLGIRGEARWATGLPASLDRFAFQPYAFFDSVWAWNNGGEAHGHSSLMSGGAGVRVSYGNRARLDLGVAVPLRRAGIDNLRPGSRILLSFSTRLVPWRRSR